LTKELENWFLSPKGNNFQEFIDLVEFSLEACNIWWNYSHRRAIPTREEARKIKGEIEKKLTSVPAHSVSIPVKELIEQLTESLRLNEKNFVNVHPQPLLNSVVATLLVTLQNPNNIAPDVSLPTRRMEEECVKQLQAILDFKPNGALKSACGTLVLDGTLGNLTALFVAAERNNERYEKRAKAFWRARVASPRKQSYLITTKNVHYSIKKCARILGFGDLYIKEIPVAIDEEYLDRKSSAISRKNAEELQKFYNDESYPFCLQPQKQDFLDCFNYITAKRGKIDAVVLTHGTTLTGTIECADEFLKMRKRVSPFFLHIDAATGGFARLIPELKEKMVAIDEADSVIVDPHKLGYVPYPCAAILFRNEEDFRILKALNTSPNLEEVMPTIEGSRPGTSAAAFWIAFRTLGFDGYRKLISRCLELAQYLAKLLDENGFQVLHSVDLNTVCFTVKHLNGQMRTNEGISQLYKRMEEDGEFKVNFVSDFCGIRVRERPSESQSRHVGIRAIRTVITNPFTTESTLDRFVEKLTHIRRIYF
jgi:glutamate/tyrosine decarboxylase-like PLP-dependent enzyme